MKIGIDISQIVYGTGVSFYTRCLVANLVKIDKKNEYVCFFSSLRRKFLISNLPAGKAGFEFLNKSQIQNSNFQIKTFKFPPLLLEQLWNRLHLLPIEKLIGKVDVFHTSDWLEPPAKCPKVTTIHDLAIFKYPETFHPRIVANQQRRLEWVKKESALIIAVSESTKKDIVEILKIPEQGVKVIYEAAPEQFKRVSSKKVEAVKKKFNIRRRYILSVATLEPRKNIRRIIEAHKILRKANKDLTLVLVGKMGWGENLFTKENTILTGYVTDEELSSLYTGAEVLVYPSLYEGFGQPILEAMVCGCPVVTSNVSSMPEIAGDAAVLVNPESVEDIARGIQKAIKKRTDLVKKGKAQAKKFSWEKTARETLAVYQSLVTNH